MIRVIFSLNSILIVALTLNLDEPTKDEIAFTRCPVECEVEVDSSRFGIKS